MSLFKVNKDRPSKTLIDDFVVPPFSTLDTRLGYWQDRKRMWTKYLGDAGETRDTEDFGRTFNIEKQGLHKKTSIFDPVLAECMYKWFCEGGTVLDPFAGSQVRGYVAGALNLKYVGVEIRQEQVDVNNRQLEKFDDVVYYCGDSTEIKNIVPDIGYDMLLTSPPYFDLEEYSKTDLSASESYLVFKNTMNYIMTQCYDLLKDDTFTVIQVGEIRDRKTGELRGFVPDVINMMKSIGWHYYNEIILINQSGTAAIRTAGNMKSRKIVKCHQNILVFYKGDVSTIKDKFKALR